MSIRNATVSDLSPRLDRSAHSPEVGRPEPFRPPRTTREVCGAHAPASADPPDTARRRWGRGARATGAADRRGGLRGRGLRAGRRSDRLRRGAVRPAPARSGGGRLRVRRDRRVAVGTAGRAGDRRRGRGRGRPGRSRRRAGRRWSGAPRAQAAARAPPLPPAQTRPQAHLEAQPEADFEAHRAALLPAAHDCASHPLDALPVDALLLAPAPDGVAQRARAAGRGAGRARAGRAGPRR